MKLRLFTAIAFTAMAVISCNEETASIGKSLTDEDDKLQVTTGVYEAFSRSLLADSVYGQNFECYFGQIKDPETETYVKSEFMTQFNLLEGTTFPSKELMLLGEDGNILVDSCEIRLFIDKTKCYGDSLTPLKMSIKELDKPMDENAKYYSNYDPEEKGLIRKDGMKKSMMFTVSNRTFSDSIRKLTGFQDFIRVRLNDPYTAKDGKKYSNFGSYILQNYYDHPEYFKNSYTFVHTLCPGLYFQITEGIGSMAYIEDIRLTAFYRHKKSDDKLTNAVMNFSATSEVLSTAKVTNDKEGLKRLVEDNTCTYLKTPAGIFTEIELPVEKIMEGHFNDSLLSVSMTVQRQNSLIPMNLYLIPAPNTILMIQKDSLNSFFEKESTYDYRDSFVANLSKNSYSFRNMGNMVTLMYTHMFVGSLLDPEWIKKHPNWNKVVLVPVTTISTATATTTSSKNTTATVSYICNNFGLTSTQLTGGNTPIKISVIYARFNEKKQ